MKRIILALVLLLPNLIYAQAGTLKPAPEFAGIKIDSSLDYCVKQFVAKGYKLEKSENNIATLKGTLGADDIELFLIATISSKKVWKAAVYFPEQSTWSGLKQKYSTLKDLLDS
ncbi:MAG TPA: hypothetical protein VHB48_09495 [Chitinophagaceae bacterium]|nr:hypothetical protein [Chitinophagaceae bacterium]